MAPSSPLSPLHRVWRLLPARPRRALLGRAAATLAPRPDRFPPVVRGGVVVAGELQRASGLGEGARLMLHALRRMGVPAQGLDTDRSGRGEGDIGLDADADRAPLAPGTALVIHINSPVLPLALLRLPRGVLRGRRIIGYWAWELPTVPRPWRAGLPFVHEVWVPSEFTRAAIEPLLPGRVHVVPHPLAMAPPVPSGLDRAAFGLPADAVIVLVSFNLASSFERKNPLAAIAAFRAAFGARTDRLLVLKIGNPAHFPADFARLKAAAEGANIRLITETLPAADSHALTACADIVLSLHRSEGFGLVPAEAMLLGRPVVATGWSGNMDYMDADTAALVAYRLIPARDPRHVFEAPDAVWADPDLAEATAQLCRLADDAALRIALGARARLAATGRLGPAGLAAGLRGLGVNVPCNPT